MLPAEKNVIFIDENGLNQTYAVDMGIFIMKITPMTNSIKMEQFIENVTCVNI